MKSRFNLFPDDDAVDILRHADEIQINLVQFDEGIGIQFKISGGFIPEGGGAEDDSGSIAVREQPDPAVLARALLSSFLSSKSKGGAS